LWEKCSVAGIEWEIGEAGLTAMMNLKNVAKSAEREVDVAAWLMDEFAVSVAPNRAAFRSPEIGWFGVCFGAEEESLNKRLDRLAKGVGTIRAIAKCFRAFRCHSFPFTASSSSRSRG
jgi:aspartate/methionine/tyrosine aminotransferase